MRCIQHPQTETFIRCSKCDAAVCADCMVTGPVGIRCPACSRGKKSPLFIPQPVGMAKAIGAGLGAAIFLGWVTRIALLAGATIGAAALGYGIAELVLRLGGRKRGRIMEGIAGGCAALAVLLYHVPWIQLFMMNIPALIGWVLSINSILAVVALGIAVVCAVGRVRYL